jgi:ABC-2 type transport system ATP-binding protein
MRKSSESGTARLLGGDSDGGCGAATVRSCSRCLPWCWSITSGWTSCGETFGFLGSNGSGKTTTIRALLGIHPPTGGELLVDGRQHGPDSGIRLGYLPEERGQYKKESVLDVMTYFGRLKGMSAAHARTWSTSYLERLGLADKAKTRMDKLSGGQQQKVQLGVTVMNDPELRSPARPGSGPG